jgi:dipeptidyl aminopeptidase/acylaminoacyl peptidase
MNRQLFEIDIASRRLTALTPPTQDVFSYSRSGKKLVYLTGSDADLQQTQAWVSSGPGIPDVTIGTGVPLMPLLYPHFKGLAYNEPLLLELWEVNAGRLSPVRTRYDAAVVSLSPDGKRVVVIANESNDQSLKYRLLDFESGVDKPLVDFPIVKFQFRKTGRYRAEWSADGNSIALTELMVNATDAPAGPARRCDLAVFEISKQTLTCISEHNSDTRRLIYSLQWRPSGDQMDVRYKSSDQPEFVNSTLQRRGSKWLEAKAAERRHVPLQLTVRESLNEPPVLIATDTQSGKSRQIFDPNPQLADIDLGNVSVYKWKDPKGRALKGGLVKPPKFDSARRYALVIQTHGFSESRFFRSGYSDTANAGRALAGRNIVVLQVGEPRPDSKESWQDAQELGTNVYLAAIDQLTADGIVDPKKVGLSGYSYTGWTVANSVARAADRFAAAEIANSDPVTLTGYYEYVDTPAANIVAESYVGARPYGAGLKLWIERVPSLATDKISAPVLFQPADPWHLIGVWDMYAALRDQGKPVELQYIRSGEHNIRKPAHVLAHQELLVDWFDFWLNDHENSAPEKAEQYARWRNMRR